MTEEINPSSNRSFFSGLFESINRLFQSISTIFSRANLDEIVAQTGCNGAKFKLDNGRVTHVVKSIKPSFFNFIRKFFGQTRLLSTQDPNAQTYNEYVGYQLSKTFKFDLVPKVTFKTKTNESWMVYLEEHKPLKENKAAFLTKGTYTAKEIELWQKLSIFNFLLGNLDPHDENIFAKFNGNELVDVKMIDLGNSMPESNPEWLTHGYLGDWGNYPIAKEPFSKTIKEFIQSNIGFEEINDFILKIMKDRPGFMTEKMDELFRKRHKILLKVARGEIKNPYQLSKIHTDEDYREYGLSFNH